MFHPKEPELRLMHAFLEIMKKIINYRTDIIEPQPDN